MSDKIDFDDIKWGSFTKQFEAYNRTAKKKMKDLSAFARMILDAPKDKFSDTTRKRANFYLNVLAKKGKSKGGARTFRITPEWIQELYGKKLPNRRLYEEELRYVRSLLGLKKSHLPKATLYDAIQLIVDRAQRNSPSDEYWFLRTILMDWEDSTGIPLVIPRGYAFAPPPPPEVTDLTTPEVIDLTGGGKIRPHIVRPYFAM